MIDEDHGLVKGVLAVGGRGDTEGHVVGEGRARQAVVGHAIGVIAASGLEVEAARALQVQRDRHLGQTGRVLGVGVDLHRGVSGDVTHPMHSRRDRRRAAVHLIDVQLDDGAVRQRGDGQVTEDRSAVETRIHLA